MIAKYRVVGGPPDAPTVVLLGSLGSTGRMWDPQVAQLADHARVVVLERRGHGDTPAVPGPYEIDDLGNDVIEAMDHLGIERAHVVGLSLGGMEAMWVAATVPSRVDRLVVLCSYAYRDGGTSWRERAATVRAHGCEAVADAGVARWLTPEWSAAHPRETAAFRAMIAGTDAEGYAACCEAIDAMDLRPMLPKITAPVLAVGATSDQIMTREYIDEIAAAVPDGRAVYVPGGHVPTVESATDVTSAIVGHIG